MDIIALKMSAPAIFLLVLIFSIKRFPSTKNVPIFIFLFSIVSFSQNFTLIYRELHQAIQIILLIYLIFKLILDFKIPKVTVYLLLFFSIACLSFLDAPLDSDAKIQLINLASCLLISTLIFKNIKDINDITSIFNFMSNLSIVCAALGLVEFSLTLTPRIEGTFANPNYYALFLGMGWCCLYHSYSGATKWALAAIVLIAIILTGSRSGLMFPIIHLAWTLYQQKNKAYLVVYSSLAALLIATLLLSGLTRFTSKEEISGSDSERLLFAKIAINMTQEHPLNGVGWGRFIAEFENYNNTVDELIIDGHQLNPASQERRVTHNDFLRIMSELGFPALLLSLLFVISTGLKLVKSASFNYPSLVSIWIGLILFSVSHNNLNTALTWIFLLLPVHIFHLYKANSTHSNINK